MIILDKWKFSLVQLSFILFISSIPFEESLIFPIVGSITRLFGFVFTLLSISHIFFFRKKISKYLPPNIFVYIILVLSLFWSINIIWALDHLFTYLQFIVIIILMVQVLSNVMIVKSLLFFSFSTILICLLLIKGFDSGIYEDRVTILGLDPNELALILNLGFATILFLFDRKILGEIGKIKKTIFSILFFLVFLIAILKTGSRTGFVCFFVNLIYLAKIFGHRGGILSIKTLFVGLLIAFLGSSYLNFFVNQSTIERILQTDQQVKEVDFTGRGFIWLQSFRLFIDRPILGYGVGNSEHFLATYFPGWETKSTHNIFFQVGLEVGVLGLFLLLYSLYSYVINTLKKITSEVDKRYWFIVFIILLLGGLTLAIVKKKYFLIFLTLGFIFRHNEEKEKNCNILRE